MTATQRLQLVYKSLPDASIQSRVLNLLLDRQVMTAAQSKEQAMEALVAWFAGEVVRLDSSCSQRDYSQALAVAIASLESRAAYYRSLLTMSNTLATPAVAPVVPPAAAVQVEGSTVSTEPLEVSNQTANRPTSNTGEESSPFDSSSDMGHLFVLTEEED